MNFKSLGTKEKFSTKNDDPSDIEVLKELLSVFQIPFTGEAYDIKKIVAGRYVVYFWGRIIDTVVKVLCLR